MCDVSLGIFAPLNKLGKPGVFSPPKASLMLRSPSSSSHTKARKKDMTGVKSKIDTG